MLTFRTLRVPKLGDLQTEQMVLSFPSRTKKNIAVKSGLVRLNEMRGASLYNGTPELLTD